jgi:hypothetical protein
MNSSLKKEIDILKHEKIQKGNKNFEKEKKQFISMKRNDYEVGKKIFLRKLSSVGICHSTCTTCAESEDENSCTGCAENHYFMENSGETFKCYNTPPNGYYLSEDVYKACDSSCSTCSDGTTTGCTACNSNFYKLSTVSTSTFTCYGTAPANHILLNNEYTPCDTSCNGCQTTTTSCVSCASNYKFKEGTSSPTQCYISPPDK